MRIIFLACHFSRVTHAFLAVAGSCWQAAATCPCSLGRSQLPPLTPKPLSTHGVSPLLTASARCVFRRAAPGDTLREMAVPLPCFLAAAVNSCQFGRQGGDVPGCRTSSFSSSPAERLALPQRGADTGLLHHTWPPSWPRDLPAPILDSLKPC